MLGSPHAPTSVPISDSSAWTTEELIMRALEVVWSRPDYRYSYWGDVSGRGCVKLTLRRQLRLLNRCTAHWYRAWQARGLLQNIYGDVLYKLDPDGMTYCG